MADEQAVGESILGEIIDVQEDANEITVTYSFTVPPKSTIQALGVNLDRTSLIISKQTL